MSYDPARHHRRSIRLKGHDYAGGGVYFVTICAHREAIAWARGNPFGVSAAVGPGRIPPSGATCVSREGEEGATCVSREGEEGATCVSREGEEGATCVSPVRIIAEEWRRCGEIRDDVFPGEFVVMPVSPMRAGRRRPRRPR